MGSSQCLLTLCRYPEILKAHPITKFKTSKLQLRKEKISQEEKSIPSMFSRVRHWQKNKLSVDWEEERKDARGLVHNSYHSFLSLLSRF